jgi:hypothetical protein
MFKEIRNTLTQRLWQTYCNNTPHMQTIIDGLAKIGIHQYTLDHFAVIDLAGPHTGIPILSELFTSIGYIKGGNDYLPDKQNDFLWMYEDDSINNLASTVLPQVVTADFRLNAMPPAISLIIEKYAHLASQTTIPKLKALHQQILAGEAHAQALFISTLCDYFTGRDWPLPTVDEFHTVQRFNELLAWVLIFGRRPNHFTISVHLLDQFETLEKFNHFVEHDLSLQLNTEGGVIKGSAELGLQQSSTVGVTQTVKVADGEISLPTGFAEFIFRFPNKACVTTPRLWQEYFTGFIAQNANHVIESLYM